MFISSNCICPMLYGSRSPIYTAKHYLLLILPSLPTTVHLHASYTLLIRVTAAQLPPRKGRLRTNSFVGSQLSRLHVLPDGQCSASPPFPPDTCLFPSFTSTFLYPTAMYPFSTDFPVCVTLVKYLKQTRSYITW